MSSKKSVVTVHINEHVISELEVPSSIAPTAYPLWRTLGHLTRDDLALEWPKDNHAEFHWSETQLARPAEKITRTYRSHWPSRSRVQSALQTP